MHWTFSHNTHAHLNCKNNFVKAECLNWKMSDPNVPTLLNLPTRTLVATQWRLTCAVKMQQFCEPLHRQMAMWAKLLSFIGRRWLFLPWKTPRAIFKAVKRSLGCGNLQNLFVNCIEYSVTIPTPILIAKTISLKQNALIEKCPTPMYQLCLTCRLARCEQPNDA